MICRFVIFKPTGSRERMCKCLKPKLPTEKEINISPWKHD